MREHARLLIYSHDSFGLGHLRRCRTIAHHLVERFKDLSVIILSGSPIIGSFDFKSRVDFVRVPGVIKLRNGDYTPLNLHIDIEKTLEIRSSIIQHTAEIFDPDMFIVDKEPLGLRGEVEGTLQLLKRRGTRLVLGLRDVMDEPQLLLEEWRRKNVFPALRHLFDELWVYGVPEIFDPLVELPGMAGVADKVTFTGYLRRELPDLPSAQPDIELPEEPYILVTTGGGGDGDGLVDWVIAAYEADPGIPFPALILFGPFMPAERRAWFLERIARLPKLHGITFAPRVEPLFERALGVVAMGGYNTFCEILSFWKPALIVPRTQPRLEQLIRAERAARLGLVRLLPDDDRHNPYVMAQMLRDLPSWPAPDPRRFPRLLDGLERIAELAAPWLDPSAVPLRWPSYARPA